VAESVIGTSTDPYEVLQLHPTAHPLLVMRAFRVLAAMYHPDNKQTGDRDAFERISAAYQVLSDPVRRASHDRAQGRAVNGARGRATVDDEGRGTAPDERRLRLIILTTLYSTRRNSLASPGLSLRVLADMTDSDLSDVQFSLWYLRGKKFIEIGENDLMAITVAGVDYVEGHMRGMADEVLALPEGRAMFSEPAT
jgi:curved DNA-binding protein CbpA